MKVARSAKSKCVLYMLMTEKSHCNKQISTGLLTFYKARYAIEALRTNNNITFRDKEVKRYQSSEDPTA